MRNRAIIRKGPKGPKDPKFPKGCLYPCIGPLRPSGTLGLLGHLKPFRLYYRSTSDYVLGYLGVGDFRVTGYHARGPCDTCGLHSLNTPAIPRVQTGCKKDPYELFKGLTDKLSLVGPWGLMGPYTRPWAQVGLARPSATQEAL